MHLLPLSLLSLCLATTSSTSSTPKRGLIYIGRGTRESPGDDIYWAARNTSLTWYYNYSFYSTRTLQQNPSLEYVPMLWGAPAASAAGDFGRTIRQYKSSGMNINYVLGFNEPDHPKDGGGSDIPLADAVRIWKTEMEPVRSLGIKLGSPATVGNAGGIAWLQNFIRMCDGCHFDFIPLHYYGGFEGMLSYIAQARMAFANVTSEFWLTEFALPAAPLEATQRDFNQSLAYLDNANNRLVFIGNSSCCTAANGALVVSRDIHTLVR